VRRPREKEARLQEGMAHIRFGRRSKDAGHWFEWCLHAPLLVFVSRCLKVAAQGHKVAEATAVDGTTVTFFTSATVTDFEGAAQHLCSSR
jgi:hypothetical protein